ncbi:hypothetical protein TWF481_001368 [Arthrobotrys musiformis]|uniref:Uncharacterized protein n=1 Tax=Arthrobotrys musiformis TaxID=47236 RepID=A0AAV9WQL7_9PEZI
MKPTLLLTIHLSHAAFIGETYAPGSKDGIILPIPLWIDWVVTNSATLLSIGSQLDFLNDLRTEICPLGPNPTTPPEGLKRATIPRKSLTFLIFALEQVILQAKQDLKSVEKVQRLSDGGFVETSTGMHIREKLGWDGRDRAEIQRRVMVINTGIWKIKEMAFASWTAFHNMDFAIDQLRLKIPPLTDLTPTASAERVWEIAQWVAAMNISSTVNNNPFVAVDLQVQHKRITNLIYILAGMGEATENVEIWKKFGTDNDLGNRLYSRKLNEQRVKYDPDLGYRIIGRHFNVMDLFDYFMAWYGCWYGPWKDLIGLILKLTPLPGTLGETRPRWKDANVDLALFDPNYKLEVARHLIANNIQEQEVWPWDDVPHHPSPIDSPKFEDDSDDQWSTMDGPTGGGKMESGRMEMEDPEIQDDGVFEIRRPMGKIEVKRPEGKIEVKRPAPEDIVKSEILLEDSNEVPRFRAQYVGGWKGGPTWGTWYDAVNQVRTEERQMPFIRGMEEGLPGVENKDTSELDVKEFLDLETEGVPYT